MLRSLFANEFGPPGACTRATPALPPPKGVMLANFFWPTGARTRKTTAPPFQGVDAVRFSAPPPREVQGKILLLAPGLCFLASRPL